MSDNYKTIARARDIAKALLTHLTWTKSSVVAEMGVTFSLYSDIMEMDPVSIKIRTPTVNKLHAFIEKHEAILDKEPTPPGVTRSKPEDPFPIVPNKPTPPKPPPPPNDSGGDPLAELDALVEKFARRGYKLHTRIEKMVQS